MIPYSVGMRNPRVHMPSASTLGSKSPDIFMPYSYPHSTLSCGDKPPDQEGVLSSLYKFPHMSGKAAAP